ISAHHVILFGDPGSNSLIGKALKQLPIVWTPEKITLGANHHSSRYHAPSFICESPFAGARDRYVVINSGHTFHEKEFAAFNYLLFPRAGDWAIYKVDGNAAESWQPSSPEFAEERIASGFFNEA